MVRAKFLIFAGTLLFAAVASGQSSDDAELARLKTQQAILEAQLAIVQNQQKMTIGVLPGADIKPKEGSIKVDGEHPIESLVLAYGEVKKAANDVAAQVVSAAAGSSSKKIFIYDPSEITSLLNYLSFSKQLAFVLAQLAVEPDRGQRNAFSPQLGAGLAEGSIKAAIDIIGLFRTDTEIHGKDFAVDDAALVAAVASALTASGCRVYQPAVIPVNLLDSESKLLADLTEARTKVAGMPKDAAIGATLEALQAALLKADDAGTPVLSKLLRAEKLYYAMTAGGRPDGYFLMLKMSALGGGVKTKQNFFIPTRLYYSGGTIVTFTLFDPTGAILRSGTVSSKSPFIKARQKDEQVGDFK